MSDFAYTLNLQPISQEEYERCMELIARQADCTKVLERAIKTTRLVLLATLQTEPSAN